MALKLGQFSFVLCVFFTITVSGLFRLKEKIHLASIERVLFIEQTGVKSLPKSADRNFAEARNFRLHADAKVPIILHFCINFHIISHFREIIWMQSFI